MLVSIGISVAAAPVLAFNPPAQPAVQLPLVVFAKGAATPTELAQMVLQALQNNNFENLNGILLDDEALGSLKNKGTEDMKALLENKSADEIKNNLKIEYEQIVQKGISQTINWSEVILAEAKAGKGSPKNPMVQPITLTLTNKAKQPVQIVLETAKLNNRYFLFQRMELKPAA